MPCRLYLTACAFSLAFGCLIGLMIANRVLMALESQQDATGKAREDRRREAVSREMEWLVRDTAEKGLIFERDANDTIWSVN